jgi:hypothetical protein
MFKKLGMAMVLVGSFGGAARAGYRNNQQVIVDTSSRVAYGTMGAARNSSDSNQMLACAIFGSATSSLEAYCFATDQNGASLSCHSLNSNVIAAAQHAGSDSYIYFVADSSGTCTTVDVYNGSEYQPKQP